MHISIEGLPGSGKTELLKLLKKTKLNFNVHFPKANQGSTPETTDKQVWTELVKTDPARYVFGQNINQLLEHSVATNCCEAHKLSDGRKVNETHVCGDCRGDCRGDYRGDCRVNLKHIYERSPYTIQHVLSPILLKRSYLHKEELKLQETLIDLIGWTPDIIIYLDCSPEVCLKRCAKAGKSVDKVQMKELFDQYEWVLDQTNCDIPVYRVNTNDDITSVLYNVTNILNSIA